MSDQLLGLYSAVVPFPGNGSVSDADIIDHHILLIWESGGLLLFAMVAVMGISVFAYRQILRSGRNASVEFGTSARENPLQGTHANISSPPPRHLEFDPQEFRALLHATLGCLSSPAAILDNDGNPIDGNDAWLSFAGTFSSWPTAEMTMLSKRDGESVAGQRRDCIFDAYRNFIECARHSFKTIYLCEIDRHRRVFEFSATRINARGVPHILVVHQDITEKENAANKLKELSRRTSDIQEAERQRIAREIHDSTSQHLVAISLNLMNLRREVAASAQVERLLGDIEKSAADAQQEIRLFSYLLYPSQLGQSGAKATIEHYVKGFSKRAKIKACIDICDEVDALDIHVQQSLLRVIQEALVNVHRHAKATSALVKIAPSASGFFAIIADDGIGMSNGLSGETNLNLGVGIPGMMSRVQELGGSFNVTTSPGGTSLVIEIPWLRSERSGAVAERVALN